MEITLDNPNRDRMDALAAKLGLVLLSTSVLALKLSDTPVNARLLLALMATEFFAYIYTAGRVGAHGGYTSIATLESWRYLSIAAYTIFLVYFAWAKCF